MRNISAKLFCICTSAEFRLSFQLVEILTLQVSLAEIYSFIMILNSNMIFWTPKLEYLTQIQHYPFLNQSQQIDKIVSENDQEIPQSQTADNPVAPRGRAAQPSRHTRKTN